MPISVLPLHPLFAAEVSGVDLRRPPDSDAFYRIAAALDHHAVLVFRDQLIDDDQQIAISRQFGRLETAIGRMRRDRKLRLPNPEIADVSNLDENNAIRPSSDSWRMFQLANQLWHTDSSFKCVSGKLSLLSAREVPPTGGETEFADLRAAYEALDPVRRAQLEGLVAEHSIFHSRSLIGYTDFSEEERAALPPVPQALVRVHPGSGRKTLYLGAHASHIIGRPVEEGRALLAELTAFATQPRFVHQHRWRVGDLVIWDNRCTLHRGRPFDDASARRDMRRTTVEDVAPSLQQAGVALPVAS
jgi:alpha-ketoglutarate-dependent 2,4-dichlorophenoxyacetate dioxygenase